jgi:uncharacterized protein with von Willebrand factor type A (vWA) domain
LGTREFEKAKSLLTEAAALAKSPEQQRQLERLTVIAPLVEQFQVALRSATDSMAGGGEVIKVLEQEISFVEAQENMLIVRNKGTNSRYKWNEIPVLLAFAFADLKLDQSPKSSAIKAAYAAVHPKTNDAMREKARKLMQSAATAGAVPENTHEVFDDDYSLD